MIYHSHDSSTSGDPYSLDDLDKEARLACADLKEHLGEFDVIAVTGLSGILPAVPVSLRLKVPLAILRKKNDDTHQRGGLRFSEDGACWINGHVVKGCRVLWLDDFVSMGETEGRIKRAVEEAGGRIVASYLTQNRLYETRR